MPTSRAAIIYGLTLSNRNMNRPARSSGSLVYYNFMIWGKGSEALLNKVSGDIIRIGKRTVPLVIALAYIIAGWIIYII